MKHVLAIVTLLIAGCSSSANIKLAEQAIPLFHEMLDASQFDEIYAASAEDLKKVADKKEFVTLLEAVHRKLGNTKASAQKGWNVNYHTSGAFVTLTYATTYAEGEASERFVYRMQGSTALLAGYHINSNALLVK